jgi:magnesium-transporting ATPase (P-type)
VGLAALAAFLIGRSEGDDVATTMAFATVALSELLLVFAVRSPIRPAWEAPRNPYLLASVILSAILVGAGIYVSALNDPLGTVPLAASELAVVALLALIPFVFVEVGKAVLRWAGWSVGGEA